MNVNRIVVKEKDRQRVDSLIIPISIDTMIVDAVFRQAGTILIGAPISMIVVQILTIIDEEIHHIAQSAVVPKGMLAMVAETIFAVKTIIHFEEIKGIFEVTIATEMMIVTGMIIATETTENETIETEMIEIIAKESVHRFVPIHFDAAIEIPLNDRSRIFGPRNSDPIEMTGMIEKMIETMMNAIATERTLDKNIITKVPIMKIMNGVKPKIKKTAIQAMTNQSKKRNRISV